MTIDLIAAVMHLGPALSSSSDSGPWWLLFAGPAGGAGTYWVIYRYYRNIDKSHDYERDTLINAQPVRGGEEKVDHISRTTHDEIDGSNGRNYRQRVQRVR